MRNKSFAALTARLITTPSYIAERTAVAFLVDINARMLAQGVNNADLAQLMGTTRSCITRIFRGNAKLSVQTMARLAAAVGSSVRVQLEDLHDNQRVAWTLEMKLLTHRCFVATMQLRTAKNTH